MASKQAEASTEIAGQLSGSCGGALQQTTSVESVIRVPPRTSTAVGDEDEMMTLTPESVGRLPLSGELGGTQVGCKMMLDEDDLRLEGERRQRSNLQRAQCPIDITAAKSLTAPRRWSWSQPRLPIR